MIVFSGFKQYKYKVEKPLRWMPRAKCICLSARTFITYIFFSPMAPKGGYMLCKMVEIIVFFQHAVYFECILSMI